MNIVLKVLYHCETKCTSKIKTIILFCYVNNSFMQRYLHCTIHGFSSVFHLAKKDKPSRYAKFQSSLSLVSLTLFLISVKLPSSSFVISRVKFGYFKTQFIMNGKSRFASLEVWLKFLHPFKQVIHSVKMQKQHSRVCTDESR